MIIRVYIACLLSFACAEDITYVRGANGAGGAPTYYLEEQSVDVGNTSDVTLKDVKFISKISETVSLLVTNKNKTWRYDEEANTMEAISFADDNKKEFHDNSFQLLDKSEFGFSKQLLRFYEKKDKSELELVINYASIDSSGKSFGTPLRVDSERYDKDDPPVILYLDADKEEDWAIPSVFMYNKGGFILLSNKMTCEDKDPSPVLIGGSAKAGSPVIAGASDGIVGGIGSDGKSFWALTHEQFVLYRQHGCKLEVNEEGKRVSNHKYTDFPLGEGQKSLFQLSYQDKLVHGPPLGVWIDVDGNNDPVVKGRIISISKDGKLLTAE